MTSNVFIVLVSVLTLLLSLSLHLKNNIFFFFNDSTTTKIYTLSLHDALPIFKINMSRVPCRSSASRGVLSLCLDIRDIRDRKSTRLNSSHLGISYAVFCLKKKINN